MARSVALLLLLLPLNMVASFPVAAPSTITRKAESFPGRRRMISLHQSATSSNTNKNKNPSDFIPSNEFSRTIPPDRIRSRTHGSSGSKRRGREYQVSISATGPECQALAQRFSLKAISSLEASVEIRATAGGDSSVEVEGSVVAAVTQTCVRTNEDFPVQLEFPLYAIVRPVAPLQQLLLGGGTGFENRKDNMKDTVFRNDSSSKQERRDNSVSYRTASTLDDLDLAELQRMLQEDIALENDDSSLMEDEAIYPIGGMIDIGELVSQLFWLNLDPYPKKPGTDRIQRTISG